jgi:hypothetical protein
LNPNICFQTLHLEPSYHVITGGQDARKLVELEWDTESQTDWSSWGDWEEAGRLALGRPYSSR